MSAMHPSPRARQRREDRGHEARERAVLRRAPWAGSGILSATPKNGFVRPQSAAEGQRPGRRAGCQPLGNFFRPIPAQPIENAQSRRRLYPLMRTFAHLCASFSPLRERKGKKRVHTGRANCGALSVPRRPNRGPAPSEAAPIRRAGREAPARSRARPARRACADRPPSSGSKRGPS